MNKVLSFKKIVSIVFFAAFLAVFLTVGTAQASFWDWFKGGSDNTAAVAKAAKIALRVEKNGKGTVTSDDGKINCGRDCKEVYSFGGSAVSLTATPTEGFTFDKWTGNMCDESNTNRSVSKSTGITKGYCRVSFGGKSQIMTTTAHFKKFSSSSSSSKSSSSKSSSSRSSKSSSSSKSSTITPTIKVVSPNGGEVWRTGTKKNINFKGNLKAIVDISIEWGGESSYTGAYIGESVTLDKGKISSYSWTIPATLEERNDYRIRVNYKGGQGSDLSDKTFTIKNASSSSSSKSSKSSKSRSSKSSSSSKSSATSTYTYTLKINKSGKGYVSDGSEKRGIDCGTDCSEKYWDGAEVKLTAVPNGGYVFEKFTPGKECSSIYSGGFGLNDNKLIKQAFAYGPAENVICVTTMNKNKTITAVFKKISGKASSSSKSSRI